MPAPESNLKPPPIPDHELLRLIGRGSYGDVWLARTVLGEFRAVKVVYRDRFEHERPYEREFEGIRKFEPISRLHDSQVDILHVGCNDAAGCFYYVMELADSAEGEREKGGKGERENEARVSLDERNAAASIPPAPFPPFSPATYQPHTLKLDLHRRVRLSVDECLSIGLALTTAVQHLHEHGLVHRDIKPSNIIFVGGVPKLADIGLVASMDQTMSFVGTSGYLPPEGPGTPQGDLYSLGKVLYEISTGRDRQDFPKLPPELIEVAAGVSLAVEPGVPPGGPGVEISERVGQGQPNPAGKMPPSTAGGTPAATALLELNAVILKACAHDPRQRYQSAQEMSADLALLQKGKSVRRVRGHQRLWSQVKQAAFGLVLLALVVAGVARMAQQPPRNEAAGDGPPSTNELANALCAKGLLVIRSDNYTSIAEAYTNFHRAIQLDPYFARPYVGLFELRPWEEVPGLPPISADELRGIVRKLTELAPKLAVTYCAQSFVAWSELDYVKAREYGLRAIQADPDCALARTTYGLMLNGWGWPVEARREIEAARRLAPSKVSTYRVLAHTYYMERDFPKAMAVYREALTWEPHHLRAYGCIAQASRAMGDYLTAIANDEQIRIILGTHDAASKAWYDGLRQAVAEQGAFGYWRKQETRYAKEPDANFYDQALCQMHLGNTNVALALLDRSFETRETTGGSSTPRVYVLLFDEVWDGVRDDSRFKELLDKIGYTKVMPKRR